MPLTTTTQISPDPDIKYPSDMTFRWYASPEEAEVIYYELQIDTVPTFDSGDQTFFFMGSPNGPNSGIPNDPTGDDPPEIHKLITGLTPAQKYYWRVRAVNEVGPGMWAKKFTFETAEVIPALLTPTNLEEGLYPPVEFTWTEIMGASDYRIQIADIGDTEFVDPIVDEVVGSTSHEMNVGGAGGLQIESSYRWRVKADDDWSAPFTFFTKTLAQPQLSAFDPGTLEQPIEASWTEIEAGDGYKIQIATDDQFADIVQEEIIVGSSELSFIIDDLETGTYYCRVTARRDGIDSTNWSNVESFETEAWNDVPTDVTVIHPEGETYEPDGTPLEWQPNPSVEKVLYYEMIITGNGAYHKEFLGDPASGGDGIVGTQLLDEGVYADFLFGAVYHWQIRAVNAYGSGNWVDKYFKMYLESWSSPDYVEDEYPESGYEPMVDGDESQVVITKKPPETGPPVWAMNNPNSGVNLHKGKKTKELKDAEIVALVEKEDVSSDSRLWVGVRADEADNYVIGGLSGGDTVEIVYPEGAGTGSKTATFIHTEDTKYWIKLQVMGKSGVARIKVWEDGTDEPTDWLIEEILYLDDPAIEEGQAVLGGRGGTGIIYEFEYREAPYQHIEIESELLEVTDANIMKPTRYEEESNQISVTDTSVVKPTQYEEESEELSASGDIQQFTEIEEDLSEGTMDDVEFGDVAITDDFSGYTEDEFPDGWTPFRDGQEANCNVREDEGNYYLELDAGSTASDFYVKDNTQHEDQEILALIEPGGTGSNNRNWISLRINTATNAQYYTTLRAGNTLEIASFIGTSFNQLGTVTFNYSAGTKYWIRFRAVGTALKAKVWADGNSEPADWMVEETDDSLASGLVGFGARDGIMKVHQFGLINEGLILQEDGGEFPLSGTRVSPNYDGLNTSGALAEDAIKIDLDTVEPEDTSVKLEISTDDGSTWTEVTTDTFMEEDDTPPSQIKTRLTLETTDDSKTPIITGLKITIWRK